MKIKVTIAVFILSLVMCMPPAAMPYAPSVAANSTILADGYYRTELYFGRSIPGGGMVSDEEWDKFLAEVVTPRLRADSRS